MKQRVSLLSVFVGSIFFSAILCSLYLWACRQSVSPDGTAKLLENVALPAVAYGDLAAVCAVVSGVVICIKFLWKRDRNDLSRLAAIALFCLIYIPASFLTSYLGKSIRQAGFERITNTGRVLVAALKEFEAKHGSAASGLEILAPEYMTQIPETGLKAYPIFHYLQNGNSNKFGGCSWLVYVEVSKGDTLRDYLVYYSNQNYPRHQPGNYVTLIRNWALISTGKEFLNR